MSEYVAAYVRQWGGLDASPCPDLADGLRHAGDVGSFDNPFVTMVNPCAVKGIDIFVALAARLPHLQFAAVPTWGTNAQDLAALRSRPNITLLDPVDDIDDLLRRTRVVLVPSLWAEARSRFVVEAMLRGVPVIASDAGGIHEAKLGVPYLIPVNLITRYKPAARRESGTCRGNTAAEYRSVGGSAGASDGGSPTLAGDCGAIARGRHAVSGNTFGRTVRAPLAGRFEAAEIGSTRGTCLRFAKAPGRDTPEAAECGETS